jgi:hypothetical protein
MCINKHKHKFMNKYIYIYIYMRIRINIIHTFLYLVIGLTNEHGQYFEETVHIAMSTRFYVWIKYMVLIPLCLLYIPLLMMRKKPKMI